MNAIEVMDLDFSYSRGENLLKNVSMKIPQGGIYGFLGPNGAGKTTTLKLILNLLKNNSKGKISVLGNDIASEYPNYLNHIGSLIEEASIYSHLTAKENLKIWSNFHDTASNRIEEVLEIIGLSTSKNKKVKTFSTGMKQRLGIGISIMHDPQILILDEPTNGLDPLGIKDLRKLLRNLTTEGKTILLSSHILSEVEKLVDQIGIIKQGSIIYEGSLEQLNSTTMLDSNVIVKVDKNELAKQVLEKHFPTKIIEGQLSISTSSQNEINQIVRLIIDNEIMLFELIRPKKNLETIFMKLAK